MALALPFGLAIGLSLGALGGGGAVLALPVLVYALEQDVHAATTASLAVVAAAALVGAGAHASQARICWRHAILFVPAALVGTVAGTMANEASSGAVILLGFVPILMAAAAFTWRRAGAEAGNDRSCPPLDRARTFAAGVAVGALTGFFGVGGGFLVVPVLTLAMHLPLRRAIGTSLVIIAAVSVSGLAVHLWRDATFEAGPTLAMAVACAAGALAGARVSARLPQRTLGRAFALLLAVVGIAIPLASALTGGVVGG